jgi:hypothetical protein
MYNDDSGRLGSDNIWGNGLMTKIVEFETKGKISTIDYAKSITVVKDSEGISYPLKWKPVLDDLMRKQKPGFRVKVTAEKDMDEPEPQFWIKNCVFDDTYKKDKSAYASSPEEKKEILLQSCMRTGAMVYVALVETYKPKVGDTPEVDLNLIYDSMMDKIRTRAFLDAAEVQKEAKKV